MWDERQTARDILCTLLTFLNAKELIVYGTLTKENYKMIQDERLWERLQKLFPVSFPWTLRPLSSKQHVIHLEKLRQRIRWALPVLPLQLCTKFFEAKLVLIGDRKVGSSSLTNRFIKRTFQDNPLDDRNDLRVCYAHLQIHGLNFRLKILEKRQTLGHTPYSNMLYKGPSAILLVFDITKAESFLNLSHHIYELERHVLTDASGIRASSPRAPPANTFGLIPRLLVGTKGDLNSLRQVPFQAASDFARQNNMIYIETSSKTGDAVELLFFMGVTKVIREQGWMQNLQKGHQCDPSCRSAVPCETLRKREEQRVI